MPIETHASSWFLQSLRSTYALGIAPEGYLQHLHWGAPVRPADLFALRPGLFRPFGVAATAPAKADFSLETLPSEYPFAGSGDFRLPAIEARQPDGTQGLRLLYRRHRRIAGKPGLPGLPATYVEKPQEAETLEIDLVDERGSLEVTLRYTVFAEFDAIARSVTVRNIGPGHQRLLRILSSSVDFGERTGWHWLHLSGAWARERSLFRQPLRPGLQAVQSARGASSHQHNPFAALLAPEASEEAGEVYGFSLVYSGNFTAEIELDSYANARVQLGINPQGFAWHLEPGESFHTPETVMVYSSEGLGGMSRTYHRLYRTRLCRGPHRDAPRPVLLNNWEATYFDFDQARLVDLAKRARALGVELFVLDDGWFGRRDNDTSSLGDWVPHPRKLPGGLGALAKALAREGLQFGLWFEPEMVSPESDLYKAHPDWCLHVPGRLQAQSRNQLVLDFSRPEVREHVYRQMAVILRSAPIRYIKWDMNRHLSQVASHGREPARQAETAHRHILGLYAFIERLTAEFPAVLFESCSGGGGRFDPGMLYYMPQVWTSDNTDAISRLFIQHGTSLVYPLSSMGAHISAVPNHQVGRTTSLPTRADVAMTGAFGLELDLLRCEPAELDRLKRTIAGYKRVRRLLARGELYRLKSPFDGPEAAWMVVAPDRTEALVFHVRMLAEANGPLQRLRLRGLEPDWLYRDTQTGMRLRGDALMNHGWIFPAAGDFASRVWHLKRVGSRRRSQV